MLHMRQTAEWSSRTTPIERALAWRRKDYSWTMSSGTAAARRHVVIVGGGVAAVETLLALRAAPRGGALDVTLVAPNEQLEYRPLAVLEPFGPAPTRRFPLAAIAADGDAALVRDTLRAVDGAARAIVLGDGSRIAYDVLVVAAGARRQPALKSAETFLDAAGGADLRGLLGELDAGAVRSVAFVVPPGSGWALPLYELTLLTAHHARERGLRDVELTLVTHEPQPLAVVAGEGGAAVAQLLDDAGVRVLRGRRVCGHDGRTVVLEPPGGGPLLADRVVALPRLAGPAIDGLPADAEGFVHVDDHMRVPGLDGVYAVGDATTFPVKQGGLAAQQADLAAALIARAAGPDPSPRARLRSILLTGDEPLYLQALIEGARCVASSASRTPPWSPPQKIAARYLAPYLDALDGG